ncbi:hypothetical protein Cgig2_021544 [Carnegiea gigantea]|uniref:Uncharacterized protein n=1 Tax=Carnegiea gigantea TaxID=171969 RepID=A0A9Q1GSP4_9CARY|nr:hypothetical protein Cgig2_021544 [Carnegiea gigantea]
MDDYLWGIKQIADSLASIRLPIFDMELITQTLNGVAKDYHILATTLSDGSNLLTFDDLQVKLIHYKQRLKFLKAKSGLTLQHQPLAISHPSPSSSVNSLNQPTLLLIGIAMVAKIMEVVAGTIGTTIIVVFIIKGVTIVLPTIPLIPNRLLIGPHHQTTEQPISSQSAAHSPCLSKLNTASLFP